MSPLLDTSVVVRYLTRDPAHLASDAVRLIDSGEDLLITDVAILEAIFALQRLYDVPRNDIIEGLSRFIRKSNIQVFGIDKIFILQGLELCRPSNRTSFGDALIWAAARSGSDSEVYTFDRRFPGQGITVLDPAAS